jgi:HSP20 family molecular chaperone IbpA
MEDILFAQDVWPLPSQRFPFCLYEEGEGGDLHEDFQESAGLSVYEDMLHIYVEAYVPGLSQDEIEVSLEKGALCIKAIKKQEKRSRRKKFYKRAVTSFSYYVTLPVEVEQTLQQSLCCGILKVVLVKKQKKPAEKILFKNLSRSS